MKALILSLILLAGLSGTAQAEIHKQIPKPGIKPINQSCLAGRDIVGAGFASWYGAELHGQRTADGGRFDMLALTAAHPSLPFGTRVQVKNKRNGKTVIVKITDRGPYAQNRVIDVSKEASRKLQFTAHGTAPVEIRRCLSKAAFEKEQKQALEPKPKAKEKAKAKPKPKAPRVKLNE